MCEVVLLVLLLEKEVQAELILSLQVPFAKAGMLDFDVHFPSKVDWEEFVEEWKNSNRLYFIENPTEKSVAPTAGHEGDRNERVDE
ncbi:hypothetical protein PVK06_011392 [Gossypium arboreum]|uniref:Uncharacterized protein n=1 Tax=Gossypium arboreum TaxID=29729 RepID=A0ABR0Q924_GOSAR|nr:hypothetical protein PVK06_011392 [Gossypium arboreum]